MNETVLVKLFKYVIDNSTITESGIQFSVDKVDYALDEIGLYFPNYTFSCIKSALLLLSRSHDEISYKNIISVLENTKIQPSSYKVAEINNYTIYLPVGITIEEKISIILSNKKIDFIARKDVQDIIPADVLSTTNIQKTIHQYENIYIPNTFIKVNMSAQSTDSAVSEFWNLYQILKTLLELQKSWGTKYIIHNTLDERGKINVPDWLIIKDGKDYQVYHFKLSIQRVKQNQSFTTNEVVSLKQLVKTIKNKADEKSIDFLIYRSFLLYNDALEQNDFNYCFLAFWQILETITLAERNNGETKIVINRISPLTEKILGENIPLSKTLSTFAKKRCDLVHSGIGSISNEDINKIKYICEVALAWIINNRKVYKTINTLDQYFMLNSKDNLTIRSIESAIKIIRKKT